MALRTVPVQTDPAAILSAISNVLKETEYAEHHFHNQERWCGVAAVPDEINAADFDSEDYFEVTSAAGDWGTAVCVLGSSDTPVITGRSLFDLHRINVADVQRTSPYRIRVAWGATYAAAVSADCYSDIIYQADGVDVDRGPVSLMMPKIAAGTKVWVNVRTGPQAGYFRFFLGLHEYE